MANLGELQDFAAAHNFGLTAPLTHDQVVRLAEYWLPEMRFHWDERFHPITLADVFTMVEEQFAALPPAAQEAWRVTKFVRDGTRGVNRAFDPPVVYVPDGAVLAGPQNNQFRPAVRVLNDGTPARDALRLPEAGSSAVVTHGASFSRSNRFFGAVKTLFNSPESAASDPFMPRAVAPGSDQSRVTVMATLVNLIDLLKYELTVANADAADDYDYPPDGLRHGFDVMSNLLQPISPQSVPLPAKLQRDYLLALIAVHESGGSIPDPPPGWRLNRLAWDAVTRYAFLEYYFFYAFNDFNRVESSPFANEHEGDDEGCCLVFDRNVLNLAATSADPNALLRAVPHSIITSVHEEFQNADIFKFIPPPVPPADPNWRARDAMDFTVYVAIGSHSTYLTPGPHDLVDFQDLWDGMNERAPILVALAPGLALALAILVSIFEHFIDTEDSTSDEGVHAGPDEIVGDHPAKVAANVVVLPMSADNHIYERRNEPLLQLRAFAGKWGGHDGFRDSSPPFAVKTGRYFRDLLDQF